MSKGQEKEWEGILKRVEVLSKKVMKGRQNQEKSKKKVRIRGKSENSAKEIARMGLFVASEEYLLRLIGVIEGSCRKNKELEQGITELNRWFISKNLRI